MEPGEAGGSFDGGSRGGGRSEGFGMSDYDIARESIERELADLATRDGALAALDQYSFEVPGLSFWDKARGFAIDQGVSILSTILGNIPGIGRVAGMAPGLVRDVLTGKTPEEIEHGLVKSGLYSIPGFGTVVGVGKLAERGLKGLGIKGAPPTGFEPGRGSGPEETANAVSFDRADFARQPQFSDGSTFIPVSTRPKQLDQLLRRAKAGRI